MPSQSPLLFTAILGMEPIAGAFTVWMMVFFFRLIQKPVLRRFIYLGLALGFGAYTYVPARVWTPYLIGSVWLWVLYKTRRNQKF